MPAITPERLLFDAIVIAIFLLVAFPVHEFAHAYVAYQLGDGTARLFGRLTLNPVAHFDPFGGTMVVLSILVGPFLFGWAKPTPVNPSNFRDRRNGEVLVALAGPASNLVMAALGSLVIRGMGVAGMDVFRLLHGGGFGEDPLATAAIILYAFVEFNVLLFLFNLIPIPPLDGSAILFRLLDPRTAWQIRPFLSQYGFLILFAFVFLIGPRFIGPLLDAILNILVGY